MATPRDIKLKRAEQALYVTWDDGARVIYSMAELRTACPCATCREQREKEPAAANPLKVLSIDPSNIRAVSAKLVGRYAIQFEWSDGHNTGIYDFGFLRELPSRPADPSEQI